MSLEVVEANGLVTVQDSGRKAWRKFGVPASGPMDLFAFQAANRLAGNPGDYAGFEIGLGDAVFQPRQDGVIAVTGAGYQLSISGWEFPLWGSFFVRAGWRIHLKKVDGGMWAYLAVTGGVQTPPVLGSCSTYLRGRLGGVEGRQLQPGDVIRTGLSSHLSYELAARTLPGEARPSYANQPTLDVIPGLQMSYLTQDSIEAFFSGEYSVQFTSDRMGYRLEGSPLRHRKETELISEGMTFGVIQIPPNGQPIVMMADCPTTGGYPKIGTVVSADLPLLAQCVPGKSRIRFQQTSVETAQNRVRQLLSGLDRILEASDI